MLKIYITIIPFNSCSTPFWYPAAKSFPLGEYAIDVTGDELCIQQYASQERLRRGVSAIITVIHFSNSRWVAAWLVVKTWIRILCTNLHILLSLIEVTTTLHAIPLACWYWIASFQSIVRTLALVLCSVQLLSGFHLVRSTGWKHVQPAEHL